MLSYLNNDVTSLLEGDGGMDPGQDLAVEDGVGDAGLRLAAVATADLGPML